MVVPPTYATKATGNAYSEDREGGVNEGFSHLRLITTVGSEGLSKSGSTESLCRMVYRRMDLGIELLSRLGFVLSRRSWRQRTYHM